MCRIFFKQKTSFDEKMKNGETTSKNEITSETNPKLMVKFL